MAPREVPELDEEFNSVAGEFHVVSPSQLMNQAGEESQLGVNQF